MSSHPHHVTTHHLILDLKAVLTFLEHHPDALESGDFGTFTLLPLQNLSAHIESARHGLSELRKVVDAEVHEIEEDATVAH